MLKRNANTQTKTHTEANANAIKPTHTHAHTNTHTPTHVCIYYVYKHAYANAHQQAQSTHTHIHNQRAQSATLANLLNLYHAFKEDVGSWAASNSNGAIGRAAVSIQVSEPVNSRGMNAVSKGRWW